MGVAVIIPSVDFSTNNLGKVTIQQNVDVTGLTINCNSSYTGTTFTPTVAYIPIATNQQGVTWSLSAGSDYASIDATTGVVTIKSGANANNITIVATSSYNNTIVASKTVAVTYYVDVNVLTAIAISGSSSANGKTAQYAAAYTPSNTTLTGVTWSVVTGGTYATIDASTGLLTILSAASVSSVKIRATSTHDNSIYGEKTITVTYSAYTPLLNTFNADATNEFGGSATDYLLTTNALAGKTINYIKIKVSPNSAFGSKTLKFSKITGIPADDTYVSSSYIGYIAIDQPDLGNVVVKPINAFTLAEGEHLVMGSPDGVKWLGDTSDQSLEYMPCNNSTGKFITITKGNLNIEPMT